MSAPAYEGPLLVTGPHDVSQKSFEGAGVLSGVADLHEARGTGDAGEIGSAAVGAGLDALGAVMNPLDSLAAAGVGWLIEHVAFLHEPLDALAGDPIRIGHQAQTWHNVSQALRALADDYRADADGLTGWDGEAAVAYRRAVTGYLDGLAAGAVSSAALADELLLAGAHVGTVRSLVRDLVADAVADIVVGAAVALASASFTAGTSLAAFVGWTVSRAAMTAATVAARIAELLAWLATASARLGRGVAAFDDVAAALARGAARSARAGDELASAAPALGRQAERTAGRWVAPGPDRPLLDTLTGDAAGVGVESWKQGEQAEATPRSWGDPRPREWEKLVADELGR